MVSSSLILGALVGAQLASAAAISSASSSSSCKPSTTTQLVTVTKTSTVSVTRTSTVTVTGSTAKATSTTSSLAKSSSSNSKVASSVSASKGASTASSKSTSSTTTAKSSSTTAKSSATRTNASSTTSKPSTTLKPNSTATSIAVTTTSSAIVKTRYAPSLNATFIYDLDHQPIAAPILKTSSGLSLNVGMYIVDMAQSTAEQISNYHAQGKKVGCYFSAGTWEPYRSDKLSFLPECYCGPNVKVDSEGKCTGKGAEGNLLGEWGEWWLNLNSSKCLDNIKPIMSARIKEAAEKGCDAIDPDNVDSFMNQQTYGTTAQDEVNYLLWLASEAKSAGLGIDLKNSGTLLTDPDTGAKTAWTDSLVKAFDFNVIESCHQYNECSTYDPFLKAGKPQIQIEYKSSIKKCPKLATGQKLLVYSGTTVDSNKITLSCQ